jgi:hypothetical protein
MMITGLDEVSKCGPDYLGDHVHEVFKKSPHVPSVRKISQISNQKALKASAIPEISYSR